MSLESKIQSIRDSLQVEYVRPSPDKIEQFRKEFAASPSAQDYVKITRGLTEETINTFNLGFSVEKNAITIPIYKRGELVNIKYRHLDENAKSKYTQEKGAEVWLFNEDGIEKAKAKGGLLVVEGEFDCMSVWQAGIKNVVSPAGGKDSYGVWIELVDGIPKAYISYDNDKPGKGAALELAERVGTEKSYEIIYPEGIKDANEYFKSHDVEQYKELIKKAKPFYKYKFQGVKDVIDSIRENKENLLKIKCIPFVEFEEDFLAMLSGVSNVGKTSFAMNVADELVSQGIPTLVLPIERGIRTVGKRFLQVRYNKTKEELSSFDDSDWNKVIPEIVDLPLYFSMPSTAEVVDTVKKAKRLFNTKVVIVDHLDLLVRKSDAKNINVETSTVIQQFKQLGQEFGIIFIVVHHIKKQEIVGAKPKKPRIEDLKGSSSTYQDPEVVIMLSEPERDMLEVSILKNKGPMGSKVFHFKTSTGKVQTDVEADQRSPGQRSLDEAFPDDE